MQLAITLAHHDHAYVERRGGLELLTHLRGAGARAGYRRDAIERAWQGFEAAVEQHRPNAEVCGLGLVVLQRVLLAAEDLGGLLHAFSGPSPWMRLRTTKITDLDNAYLRASTSTETVLAETFRLVTIDDLRLEQDLSQAEMDALDRLRERLISRWRVMLLRAAELWLTQQNVAKATMHGFPLIAGGEITNPPGAGAIGEGARPSTFGRWALAVTSRQRRRDVNTVQTTVRLDDDAVAYYRREGRSITRLYVEACDMHARSIMNGFKAGIPTGLVGPTSERDRALIEQALARQEIAS